MWPRRFAHSSKKEKVFNPFFCFHSICWISSIHLANDVNSLARVTRRGNWTGVVYVKEKKKRKESSKMSTHPNKFIINRTHHFIPLFPAKIAPFSPVSCRLFQKRSFTRKSSLIPFPIPNPSIIPIHHTTQRVQQHTNYFKNT